MNNQQKVLAKYFDHTALKPTTAIKDIENLCSEAKKYNFASVCVNPCYVTLAKKLLASTNVDICTVIGFPLGANTSKVKVLETKDAIKNGATEIDMVINVAKLIDNDLDYVKNEIVKIKKACKHHILKVIIETCLLDEQQKINVCKIINLAKPDFIKTSTGFADGGATVADVALLRKNCDSQIGVKASGGIRTYKDAKQMIDAGANRLGVSATLAILEQSKLGS